jgi:hypothetical protein
MSPLESPFFFAMSGLLANKLKKLSSMGPREISFRLLRKLDDMREELAYSMGRFDWSDQEWERRLCCWSRPTRSSTKLADWWLSHMRNRREPRFLLDTETIGSAADLYPSLIGDPPTALLSKADKACRGDFSFLGFEFHASDPIDWHRDPQSGRRWPVCFFGDIHIPFCDGKIDWRAAGDAKFVWELNRHEFLVDCAKAFHLTGESTYAARVFSAVDSWVVANPYLQGVNWTGPLEVAVRALSWLWAYQFCRRWEGIPAAAHLSLIKGLYQHGAYLHRHLEVYTSPNNHLVGEAVALQLLGTFFSEFDESSAWRRRGWETLISEPRRQFFEDGVSTEQSISYHYYCLGFFVLAILARQRAEEPIPQEMLERLERAFEFGMWMTLPDGSAPRIGDADDSRSIRMSQVPTWDFRNLLSIGAALFRRPDMKAVAGPFSEDALWLMGTKGFETYSQLAARLPEETCRIFPSGGYSVLRSGWGSSDDHLCFDAGSIGLGLLTKDVPVTTHGHADLLSFTLSIQGKNLIVDSGLFTFSGSPEWHRYCREVQGHNTIRVDGRSQAKLNIHNAWSCAATPGVIRRQTVGPFECVDGSHSGFYGARNVGCHKRAIVWKRGGYWLIVDRLEGDGQHLVEAFFHFAPGIATPLDGDGVRFETDDGAHALLQTLVRGPMDVELRCGEDEPEGGWLATSYGRRVPAPVARFHGRIPFPATMVFLITAAPENLPAASVEWHQLEQLSDLTFSDDCGIRVRAGSDDDQLGFRWTPDGFKLIAASSKHVQQPCESI